MLAPPNIELAEVEVPPNTDEPPKEAFPPNTFAAGAVADLPKMEADGWVELKVLVLPKGLLFVAPNEVFWPNALEP